MYQKYDINDCTKIDAKRAFQDMLVQRYRMLSAETPIQIKQANQIEWFYKFKGACLIYTMGIGSMQELGLVAQKTVERYMRDFRVPTNPHEVSVEEITLLNNKSTEPSNLTDFIVMCAITSEQWVVPFMIIKNGRQYYVEASVEATYTDSIFLRLVVSLK